jgi:outer membrane protein OmpA-like peptidoglycan-associated protein/tetratricopeptide (TPR) repeat protein
MKSLLRRITILSLLFFIFVSSFSQQLLSKRGFIKAIQEADVYYYYDQNYEKASGLYESLLKIYPGNSNLESKLGTCYLNLDGKNSEALKLLSKAILNVVANDKQYLEYGEKAPLDTYLYLAIAYHQNDSLQKAITFYSDAKKRLSGTKIFRDEYIDNQIKDCRYALEMEKKPVPVVTRLFENWLSDYPGACNPVLSKNDSVFIFTQKENATTRIFCSYKSNEWKKPVDISRQLGGYTNLYSNSITRDGKLLVIYRDEGGNGTLYFSQRKDSVWTKIKSFPKPVNSIYWQSFGFITPDGKSMYLSSNRPGGYGELDIWFSEKNEAGKWTEPVNCGNVINTPYNEDTPFYDQENGILLFSSIGHVSMGGYDVFRSVKKNGTWSNPVGLPYSLNNIIGNSFFIENNKKYSYITSLYDEKSHSRNIYTLTTEIPVNRIIKVNGDIELQDGISADPNQTSILLVDSKETKKINLLDSASYSFDIIPGEYQLYISHTGYKTDSINLSIPLNFAGNLVFVSSSLVPEKVSGGEFLSLNNILFDYNSYKLNDQAVSVLEMLKSVLINYPELKVEVAGYTDAKGSKEYNEVLADKRAQAVIDYLKVKGTSAEMFIKKSYGKSDYVALNYNTDGSDNAEGRKYNRRVTFGVVDPKTGIIIRQETYTPEQLRQPFSLRYSIVLLKTGRKLLPEYFSSLTNNKLFFIRTIKADTLSMYVLGVFYNKTDALKYLGYARDKGFKNAYILNQFDLDNESNMIINPEGKKAFINHTDQKKYTIQLVATRNPINVEKIYSGLHGVSEIKGSDGYYKYYFGEYPTFSEAKNALLIVHKAGYGDAFIRNFYELITQ